MKKLSLCTLAVAMFGLGSVAQAHTGVKDTTTEGTGHASVYTAFTISHGCSSDKNSTQLPVIAQSAVFPNADDSLAFKIMEDGTEEAIEDLSEYIDGAAGSALVSLGIKGVQDKSVFRKTMVIADENGRNHGFHFTKGKLQADLVGLTPFRASRVAFNPESCAKALKVRIAVSNWCTASKNTKADRRVDVWIGNMTNSFNDAGVMPHGFEDAPYWPTLTIFRDLEAKPLAEDCGEGYDIAVQPSDEDIDKYLPIPGFWPANAE